MRKSIVALTVCLLLAGVVVAGCGGGGDEGTTAGSGGAATAEAGGGEGESQSGGETSDGGSQGVEEPTSEAKADFVAKANAFCDEQRRQLQGKLRQALQSGQGSQKPAAQQAALSQIAHDAIGPAMEAEAEELQALGPPAGDEEQVTAIAASLEAIATEGEQNPAGLLASPSKFEKAQKLAGEYGIGACGKVA